MTWTVKRETETEAIRVPPFHGWIHQLYNHICIQYTTDCVFVSTHIHTQSFADDKKLNLIKFSRSFSQFVPAADFSIYIAAVNAVLPVLLLLRLWAAIVVVAIFKCIQHHIMRFNSLSSARSMSQSFEMNWMAYNEYALAFVICAM